MPDWLTRHEECKEWQSSGDADTEDVEGWSENEKVSQHVRVHLGPEAERDGWLFMFETMSKERGHVRLSQSESNSDQGRRGSQSQTPSLD